MLRRRLLCLCLLLLTQCKDPPPAPPQNPVSLLPPETQTGQRTFGCIVNGQVWTPAGSPLGGSLFKTQYFNQQLTVSANRAVTVNGISTDQSIALNVKTTAPGVYALTQPSGDFANLIDLVTNCTYYTRSTAAGTLEITQLDLVNRIVSGRFSFTLETPGCGQVVVTDGRFDSRF